MIRATVTCLSRIKPILPTRPQDGILTFEELKMRVQILSNICKIFVKNIKLFNLSQIFIRLPKKPENEIINKLIKNPACIFTSGQEKKK